jgi:triphosphoribosyl-dephospho-CoA synthetase
LKKQNKELELQVVALQNEVHKAAESANDDFASFKCRTEEADMATQAFKTEINRINKNLKDKVAKSNNLCKTNNGLTQHFQLAIAAEVEKEKAHITQQIHQAATAEVKKEKERLAQQYVCASAKAKERNAAVVGVRNDLEQVASKKQIFQMILNSNED